jgi:hypothetical protein
MKLTQRNKIIIGIVIAAILIIILVWSRRKKSSFIVPTTNTPGPDSNFYNVYSNIQITFANTAGTSLVLISNIAVGNSNNQTAYTIYPHPFNPNDNIVIGGVLGTNSNSYNSPIKIGSAIANSGISGTASGASIITVTVPTGHGLYAGALVNIQGTGTYDTQADCTLSGNQGTTTTSSGKVLCPAVTAGGSTVYPSAGSIVSAVQVSNVTTTTYTYVDPGIQSRVTSTGSNGVTTPVTGIPSVFTVKTVSSNALSFTYDSVPVTGISAAGVAIGGWAFNVTNATATNAYVTKDKAIADAVNTWVTGKCSYLTGAPINDPGYTANVAAINLAYSSLVNAFNNGATTPAIATINAARKADLTTALRTFLATNCPGVYTGAPGDVDIGNSTNGYGRNLTFGGSGSTGVDTSVITAANVTRWGNYAAMNPTVSTNVATSALISGSTSWYTVMVNEPITGISMQAWNVAKNFGPGSLFGTSSIGNSAASSMP